MNSKFINNPAEGYASARFGQGQGELWKRVNIPFGNKLNLDAPVDQLDVESVPKIRNMRGRGVGQVVNRPGLVVVDALGGVHSIFHLQDEVAGLSPFIYGKGEFLYHDSDVTTAITNDLSGNPLTAVIARPERSPNPWLFIADERKMLSLNAEGYVKKWGIDPPKLSPVVVNSMGADTLVISDCTSTTQDGAVWNNSVGAGAITVVDRVNTTVDQVVVDDGWSLIKPTTMNSGIQVNTRLKIGASYTRVQQILPAISSTTILGIEYHVTSPGLCTIQLATPTRGLQPNSLIQIGSEYVRVDEVIEGLDNKPCFTCTTATVHAIGDAVTGVVAFRVYGTFAVADVIECKAYQSTITPTTGTPKGIGNLRLNAARDLSQINGTALTDDDEISLGVYVSDVNRLVEGRLWFDVDPLTIANTYAAGDLSRNYYFYAFRADDLQAVADFNTGKSFVVGTSDRIQRTYFDSYNTAGVEKDTGKVTDSVRQQYDAISKLNLGFGQREKILDEFRKQYGFDVGPDGKPLYQVGSGKEQWYQLKIKVRDLQRIGEDKSRTLKNVTSVMVNFQVTQTNPSTNVTVAISSLWIGGGGNLDAYSSRGALTSAYYYRYSGWNDYTGDEGLSSPPTRKGIISQRQKNKVRMQGHHDPQITHLNLYRFGGSLPQWIHVARVVNPGESSTVEFEDNIADGSIANNRLMRFDLYAPVPTAGQPARGRCRVVGNRITRLSGIPFDVQWAAGNEIVIDGKTHVTFNQPSSEDKIELVASAGYYADVEYLISSPIRLSTPVSRVFGPYGTGAEALTYFFCGDLDNPGFLYWTNPNDPNAMTDANYIEVSTPSEPLVTGVVYDGRVFVVSSERMWQVVPTRLADGSPSFSAQEVANSRGVVSPWAITVDKMIYGVGKDGLFRSEGGQAQMLTQGDLEKLFPHDGVAGEDVNGVFAPDMSDDRYLRLTAHSNSVYFDYLRQTRTSEEALEFSSLVLDMREGGFAYDEYGDGGVVCRYARSGGRAADYKLVCATQNNVAVMTNPLPTDVDEVFPMEVWTASVNMGDGRSAKKWGDWILNGYSGNDGEGASGGSEAANEVLVEIWKDSFTVKLSEHTFSVDGRFRIKEDFAIDTEAVDVGVKVKLLSAESTIRLYNWEPSVLLRPEAVGARATDWDHLGVDGLKAFQGVLIEADTKGQAIELEIQGDEGVVLHTFTINHSKQSKKAYSFPTMFESRMIRVVNRSGNGVGDGVGVNWNLYNLTWEFVQVPEKATVWSTIDGIDLGYCGWKHVPSCYLDLKSNSSVTFSVTIDNVVNTYTVASTGGVVKRHWIRLKPIKGKLFRFRLESTGEFQLYKTSCLHVGYWGRPGESGLQMVNVFGGDNEVKAEI